MRNGNPCRWVRGVSAPSFDELARFRALDACPFATDGGTAPRRGGPRNRAQPAAVYGAHGFAFNPSAPAAALQHGARTQRLSEPTVISVPTTEGGVTVSETKDQSDAARTAILRAIEPSAGVLAQNSNHEGIRNLAQAYALLMGGSTGTPVI
jgi:hypothetical protein